MGNWPISPPLPLREKVGLFGQRGEVGQLLILIFQGGLFEHFKLMSIM